MRARSYCRLAAAIFAAIAVLQLLRIATGLSVTVDGVPIPFWPNWIAVLLAGSLSVLGFRAATRG